MWNEWRQNVGVDNVLLQDRYVIYGICYLVLDDDGFRVQSQILYAMLDRIPHYENYGRRPRTEYIVRCSRLRHTRERRYCYEPG